MRLKCFKEDPHNGGGCWTREVTFPFPPFPGMMVGWHTVLEVLVCQGNLDGEGETQVRLDDAEINSEEMLKSQGWVFHT